MMKKILFSAFLSASAFALLSTAAFAAHHVKHSAAVTNSKKHTVLAANAKPATANTVAAADVSKVKNEQQNKAAATALPSNATSLDKIAAVVNNDVIMESEITAQTEVMKKELEHSGEKMPSDSELRKKILDMVILTHLQLQIAKRAGISISNEQIDKAVESIAQRNHLDMEQFKTALSQSGIEYNTFRRQIEEQMLVGRVEQELLGRSINVSDAEVDSYLRTHNKKLDNKEARAEAQQEIFRNKFMERLHPWLKDLRASAYVKIME